MRPIAFYLPQYHPIPENNEWWGSGFTEWTNVALARPLFRGHYQPHIPGQLGFYDLRNPESREEQAALARAYGVAGFCYYHYWFAGRRILERPLTEALASGKPDFPLCVCWANETWTGVWHGAPKRILIEQTYPGDDDTRRHFDTLLPVFLDKRYMEFCGKKIFIIYRPENLPNPERTLTLWRILAQKNNIALHIVGTSADVEWRPENDGFDAKILLPNINWRGWASWNRPLARIKQEIQIRRGVPKLYQQSEVNERYLDTFRSNRAAMGNGVYPCLTHAWDNTPRSGINGVTFLGSTPEKYDELIAKTLRVMRETMSSDSKNEERSAQIYKDTPIFLRAWNEWAEGNHLEPDRKYGTAYLDVIKKYFKPHG